MKRKYIIWLVIILALAAGIYIMATKKTFLEVTVVTPTTSDIEEVISSTGTIESETLVVISSDVSGELTEVYVKIGDTIKVGTLLAQVKPDNYISITERAEAALGAQKLTEVQSENQIEQARIKVTKSKTDLERTRNLVKNEVGNEADLLTAQTNYELAVKDLNNLQNTLRIAGFNSKSASASLKDARQSLSKTLIKSPSKGIVLNIMVKKGEKVVGTGQMTGTEIMGIGDVTQLQVETLINENDINRIKKGQPTKIHIDALKNLAIDGYVTTVSNIYKSKTTADAITEYQAKIMLKPGIDAKTIQQLRLGMTATVDIVTNSKKGRMVLPIQCVLFKTDSTKPNPDGSYNDYEYVYVLSKTKAKEAKVKTGISNSSLIEIESGLSAKDSVLSGPYDLLTGGKIKAANLKIKQKPKA